LKGRGVIILSLFRKVEWFAIDVFAPYIWSNV